MTTILNLVSPRKLFWLFKVRLNIFWVNNLYVSGPTPLRFRSTETASAWCCLDWQRPSPSPGWNTWGIYFGPAKPSTNSNSGHSADKVSKNTNALRKKWFGILTVGQQFIGLSRNLASLCHAEIVLKSTTHSHSKSHAFDPFESEPKRLFSVRTLQKATWKPVALKSFGKGPSLINKFLQNKRRGQTTTEWVISSFKIYLTYYIFTPLFLLMPFL